MGVVGLTKTIAREWGQFGVRCNAVAYGKIATRLVAPKEEGASIMVCIAGCASVVCFYMCAVSVTLDPLTQPLTPSS